MHFFDKIKLIMTLIKANLSEGIDDGYDHATISAGKKGLRSGRVSELTAIADLKPGGAEVLKKIMAIANGDLKGANKVGTLHDLRIVLFDNDTKILFCTTYDGDWDAYIDDFATKIPQLMDIIFGNVVGWPGIKDPHVKSFILSKQITATGWYVGVPHLTVNDVRKYDKIITGINKAMDEANSITKPSILQHLKAWR